MGSRGLPGISCVLISAVSLLGGVGSGIAMFVGVGGFVGCGEFG